MRGGRTIKALALRTLRRRLLHWLPVLTATGQSLWGTHCRTARWYSGRGSRVTSEDNWRMGGGGGGREELSNERWECGWEVAAGGHVT